MGTGLACTIVATLVTCTNVPPPTQRPDPALAAATLAQHVPTGLHPDLRNAWGEPVTVGAQATVALGPPAEPPRTLPPYTSPNAVPPLPLGWPYAYPAAYPYPAYLPPHLARPAAVGRPPYVAPLGTWELNPMPPAPCPPPARTPPMGGPGNVHLQAHR